MSYTAGSPGYESVLDKGYSSSELSGVGNILVVVLFKNSSVEEPFLTPSVSSCTLAEPQDPYQAALSKHHIPCLFVPVLQYRACNLADLAQVLCNPSSTSGLIITSKNAALAIKECLQEYSLELDQEWHQKPVYVVGASTGRSMSSLGFCPLGESAGGADALADIIISDQTAQYGSVKGIMAACLRPWTFLVGNKTRDVIGVRLAAVQIPIRCVKVYEIVERPDTCQALETQLHKDHSGSTTETSPQDHQTIWYVFFSPSGIDSVWDWCFSKTTNLPHVRIACIGATTAAHARHAGLLVSAQATRPTPESLVDAIIQYHRLG
ncbi:hypothetical protein BASA50_004417 [Batrachochytrium salamandrivorans]|uniref:Tetrapyrrole biosynthesis uroporphyrinogen III synthase domain-containing protein n=1 Tax=Batrachochytrium salamandrivorans TaxID=1357716 RepID=A0ABQ8FFN3_9FUNG|nr:hypothetical protein BASA50_004417 [Batrachochytrium salamandrivorans]